MQAEYGEPVVSLLECRLETGRTHQIRVHLQAIGHPVVGDAAYGGARSALPIGRPFLHAARLAFDHPINGRRIEIEEPLPPDLTAVLEGLGDPTRRISRQSSPLRPSSWFGGSGALVVVGI